MSLYSYIQQGQNWINDNIFGIFGLKKGGSPIGMGGTSSYINPGLENSRLAATVTTAVAVPTSYMLGRSIAQETPSAVSLAARAAPWSKYAKSLPGAAAPSLSGQIARTAVISGVSAASFGVPYILSMRGTWDAYDRASNSGGGGSSSNYTPQDAPSGGGHERTDKVRACEYERIPGLGAPTVL